MIATNFSNVRNNFKEVCDRVVHDSDIAIITRKNDENVVLMSQALNGKSSYTRKQSEL